MSPPGERLRVIGAGLPRTGTWSLARALTVLGLGPVRHLADVAGDDAAIAAWRALLAGRLDVEAPWDGVLGGARSVVDWPASAVAVELARAHPHALVVLTVRDAEPWWASFSATVLTADQPRRARPELTALVRTTAGLLLAGRPPTRTGWLAAHDAHVRRVRAEVAPERLLCFAPAEGWGPLCRFLRRPVPAEDFPHLNDRAAFAAVSRAGSARSRCTPARRDR